MDMLTGWVMIGADHDPSRDGLSQHFRSLVADFCW
jgi:hypothetical protein